MRLRGNCIIFNCITCNIVGLAVALLAQSAHASVLFNDGQSHSVNGTIQNDILVQNKTTVSVNTKGWIRAVTGSVNILAARVQDTSKLTVAGGSVTSSTSGPGNSTGATASNSSTISLLDGKIQSTTSGPGNSLGVSLANTSKLSISGGYISSSTSEGATTTGVRAADSATITMTDGQILATTSPGLAYGVMLFGNSTFEMSGGQLRPFGAHQSTYGIVANDNAFVRLTGGNVETLSEYIAGNIDLVFNGSSRLEIVGRNFNYPSGLIAARSGTITGILADNQPFAYVFQRSSSATITLVPEPSAIILLTVGAVLLASTQLGRAVRRCHNP